MLGKDVHAVRLLVMALEQGLFYSQTGQADKAQETLQREARIFPHVGRAPTADAASPKFHALSQARRQFLQGALSLADDIF